MKTTRKIEQFLTAIALAPLSSIEQKQKEKKLQERLRRYQNKQKFA